jgi:hypothetical protein
MVTLKMTWKELCGLAYLKLKTGVHWELIFEVFMLNTVDVCFQHIVWLNSVE